MMHKFPFWQGSGMHDCVSQNKPNHPGVQLHVKSVLSLFGTQTPLPQFLLLQTLLSLISHN
jgi:hypothetical protein